MVRITTSIAISVFTRRTKWRSEVENAPSRPMQVSSP
jgi:hypothetical protein